MADFLYTIIIFPIVQIIELVYVFAFRVTNSPALALCGVSLAVSVLTLPLYFRAEKWQNIERDTQKRLKPKIDKIKAVFKGDEQYMILSTYYRQNHYHPVYAMRNTFGLLIQIPFFIAAYTYLSHLEVLQGTSFLFIKDLGKPDMLLSVRVGAINILPVLMTVINCAAGAIYTKGLPTRDKLQLYGMALIFLVLLYNSPAGLVLYWTMNNVFSLVKNLTQKVKNAKKVIFGVVCAFMAVLTIYVEFFHSFDKSPLLKRASILIIALVIFLIPVFSNAIPVLIKKLRPVLLAHDSALSHNRTFVFSTLILFLLTGLVIPGSLIASSVEEFSFIESYSSPFPFIWNTALQAAGLFLFWPWCIYALFSRKIKIALCSIFSIMCIQAIVNVFVFPEDFGLLTPTLIFSNPKQFIDFPVVVGNIGVFVALSVVIFLLLTLRYKVILYSVHSIVLITLIVFSFLNLFRINNEFVELREQKVLENNSLSAVQEPLFTFSREGKNVLFIMLDRGIAGYVPFILEEKPELRSLFSGFTWYPNCVSFAGTTFMGAPPLLGGYEYSPREMTKQTPAQVVKSYTESFLMLPHLFSEANYTSSVINPPFDTRFLDKHNKIDINIYNDYPAIHAENTVDKYGTAWLKEHPDIQVISISNLLRNRLIRFSFFKIAPKMFKWFIYNQGEWRTSTNLADDKVIGSLSIGTISNYAILDFAPGITKIEGGNMDTFTLFVNELTHEPAFFEAPDYIPALPVTDKGPSAFANEAEYHVNIAAWLLLGKWFTLLKEQGVYDNTRIIIVSDHGGNVGSNYPNNIILPNGDHVQAYNALLLVKDFNADGFLATNTDFMTSADAPLFAVNDGLVDPVNPFTGAVLKSDKGDGIDIAGRREPYESLKDWLRVHDNIFDPNNWEKVEM
jgi:YidC/Oxa1 family membrane protein insertase